MWLEEIATQLLNRVSSPRKRSRPSGLLLGRAVGASSNDDVFWPQERRFEHAAVLGHSGSGKTHFLEMLAVQHMARNEGFAFFDFHGDATAHLLSLACRFDEAAERLILIDLADQSKSPGLNVLEVQPETTPFLKASELATILRQRWGVDAFGARTEELLRNTLFTLAACNQTLTEAPLLLTSRLLRDRLVSQITNVEVQSYWCDRFDPLSEAMKAAFREPLLNKITAFLTEPSTRHLLGQAASTIDFGQAMAEGKWLLINLPKGRLREHAHTLGNLLFAQLQFAAMARVSIPEGKRRIFTIMCDEAQNLAENDLMTLFAEGRKFGISLITANQFWEQLPRELRGTLLSAATHVFFRVSAADASVLAGELSISQRQKYLAELTELRRGQAIVRVGAETAMPIKVPALSFDHDSATSVERLRSLSAARYMRSRNSVEAEILARRNHEVAQAVQQTVNDDNEGQQTW